MPVSLDNLKVSELRERVEDRFPEYKDQGYIKKDDLIRILSQNKSLRDEVCLESDQSDDINFRKGLAMFEKVLRRFINSNPFESARNLMKTKGPQMHISDRTLINTKIDITEDIFMNKFLPQVRSGVLVEKASSQKPPRPIKTMEDWADAVNEMVDTMLRFNVEFQQQLCTAMNPDRVRDKCEKDTSCSAPCARAGILKQSCGYQPQQKVGVAQKPKTLIRSNSGSSLNQILARSYSNLKK